MCMNRPIPGSPFHAATADFQPGVPREEVWADPPPGYARAKRLARIFRVAFRQVYRTRYGRILFWTNVWLWGLCAATRILNIH